LEWKTGPQIADFVFTRSEILLVLVWTTYSTKMPNWNRTSWTRSAKPQ